MVNDISKIVIGLVSVTIVIAVVILILGTTSDSFECNDLPGYDPSGNNDSTKYPSGTWAGLCFENNKNSATAILFVIIAFAVIGAVILYAVIRLFGQ